MSKKSIINIKVSGVKRLNNSVMGNPKYEFHFNKGGVATTPSDAGWVYAFSTDTFWGKWVDITYHITKAGKSILDSITLNTLTVRESLEEDLKLSMVAVRLTKEI